MFGFFGNKRRLADAQALVDLVREAGWGLKVLGGNRPCIGIGPVMKAGGPYKYSRDWIKDSDGVIRGSTCNQWAGHGPEVQKFYTIFPGRGPISSDRVQVGLLAIELLEREHGYRVERHEKDKLGCSKGEVEAFPPSN